MTKTILEVYKEKNEVPNWFENFAYLGENHLGKFFKFTNTNMRYLKSFKNAFERFEEIEKVPRTEWEITRYNQQRHKIYVVNMVESKLFVKDIKFYQKSKKGKVFSKLVAKNFSDCWLLLYLILLDGSYGKINNQIKYQVIEFVNFLKRNAQDIDKIFDEISTKYKYVNEIFSNLEGKNVFDTDFFIIFNLYKDEDFMKLYFNAGEVEKNELRKYIINNINFDNKKCSISKKFETNGNFNENMFIENFQIIYFTIKLLNYQSLSKKEILNLLIEDYKSLRNINFNDEYYNFIDENFDIYSVIISNFLELEDYTYENDSEYLDIFEKELVKTKQDPITIKVEPLDKVDDTYSEGKNIIRKQFNTLKKQTKELRNYKCDLNEIGEYHNSDDYYFISKKDKINYLEIHHLIPYQFRNDFDYSIEVLPNYICLCPNCHRKIHNAEENTIKVLIDKLLKQTIILNNHRKTRLKLLKEAGLKFKNTDLYSYYGIK
jgi:5-methylcytosine-specific restriction protein A